mgnify:CR=1 FL=1
MRQNTIKQRLKKGDCVFGTFANGISEELVEILVLGGFDFVMIDSEHSCSTAETNRRLLMAGESRGGNMFIRIPSKDSSSVLQSLDIGAQGILVPQVNSVEEARQIIQNAKYYPQGMRGVAVPRASDYGLSMPISKYMLQENDNTLIAVQCENVKCLDSLDEITALDGIDVVFIGPFDLSQSFGIPGEVFAEPIQKVIDQVLAVTKRNGKSAGIYTGSMEMARKYKDMGFTFIIVGSDLALFGDACKKMVDGLKS